MRQCKVYVHKNYAGILSEEDDGRYHFVYDDDYVANENSHAVCRAMPVTCKEYHSDVLFPYFFNILSEGANRSMQSALLHIDKNDDFGILLETAQYDTLGAVTVEPIM